MCKQISVEQEEELIYSDVSLEQEEALMCQ
jgi:hypothetical protein